MHKWYCVKHLYLEEKHKLFRAFRIQRLIRAMSAKSALDKAERIGINTAYPHKSKFNAKWKYLGPVHVYECVTAPIPGGMLGCYKDYGKTWIEACRFITGESNYQINRFHWQTKPSPNNLYRVQYVYFVRSSHKVHHGKVTTCECIVKSSRKDQLLENAYKLAISNKTKRLVIAARRDVRKKSLVEFVGIADIIPIYNKIQDGMELDRTIQKYASKHEILRLTKNPRQLLW